MRGAEHAGLRRRDQVRDADRGAENLRPADHAFGDQFGNARRQLVVRLPEARVAIVDGEPEERASLVIDGAEIAVGDQVERLLAAIVRMRAPADIGDEAGGVPPAALFRASRSTPAALTKRLVQSNSSSACFGERERSTLRS